MLNYTPPDLEPVISIAQMLNSQSTLCMFNMLEYFLAAPPVLVIKNYLRRQFQSFAKNQRSVSGRLPESSTIDTYLNVAGFYL